MKWPVSWDRDYRNLTYTNPNQGFLSSARPIIKKIILVQAASIGETWLHIHIPDFNKFSANGRSSELIKAWSTAGFEHQRSYKDDPYNEWFRIGFRTGDQKFIEFFQIAQKYENIYDETYNNILHNVGCSKKVSTQQIDNLVEDNQINDTTTPGVNENSTLTNMSCNSEALTNIDHPVPAKDKKIENLEKKIIAKIDLNPKPGVWTRAYIEGPTPTETLTFFNNKEVTAKINIAPRPGKWVRATT